MKDQVVFSQGDPADTVCRLQRGNVKINVVSRQGKEAILGFLTPGDFFGEDCLSGHAVRFSTATAVSACSIAFFTKPAIVRMLRDDPSFANMFLAHLLSRNVRLQEDLVDQLFNSSERRLARVLLQLAHFGMEGTPEAVITNISHDTLAKMIGTTRSRVTVFMNKFRQLGFIDYNDGLEVHRSLLSFVLHE
jgi:CRP-like cAMP-binding protein